MSSPSPARRRTARAVRAAGDVVQTAAPVGPIVVVMLHLDGLHLTLPLLHLVVVLLAALGVDRLGLLLLDLGHHIERHRPTTAR